MRKTILKATVCLMIVLSIVLSTGLSGFATDEYEAFLDRLGYFESRNNYTVTNQFGYLGRWQIGKESLRDIGFLDSRGNWTALAQSLGVNSTQDFLNTPAAQDYAIRLYDKKLWSYIQYLGDDQYIGAQFQGITVTMSGLVAAAHLVGAGGLHEMFMTGVEKHDALGNSCLFYMSNLAGYDISGFLGADLSKYLNSAIKSKAQLQKIRAAMQASSSNINLYGNTSECNYLIGTSFAGELNEKNYFSRNEKIYAVSVDTRNRHDGYNSLKISGKSAGKIGSDVAFRTDTNGNVAKDGYIGDYKKMTLSFYAKSSVDSVKLSWRFGYAAETYEPVEISKGWKKYSFTFTKKSSDGSMLYLYFDKAADVFLSEIMLVDGENSPTLFRCETSKCIKTIKAIYLSSYGKLPVPTREGYKFEGWYTSKSGGKKVDASTPAYDRSLNLYAHWTKIPKYVLEKATEYNGHYYTLFTDDLTWEQAKEVCERMGGYLVVVNDEQENEMLVELCTSTSKGLYWIGAYADDDGKWSWVNGEKFDYTAWDKNQPSGGNEKYAQIYAEHSDSERVGKWNDALGTSGAISWFGVKNVGFVCEFDPKTVVKATAQKTEGSSTYTVFDQQIGWYNANFYCQKNGGNLVTVTDKDENSFVGSLIHGGKSDGYWMGATNLTGKGEYLWTTGESFEYKNWCRNNPSNSDPVYGTDHFVMMERKTKQFNDIKSDGADGWKVGFVMEVDSAVPKIERIRIAVDDREKLLCFVGDRLDTSSIKVVAQMSDGTMRNISYGYYIDPVVFDEGGLWDVKVEYVGHKTSFKVFAFSSPDPVRVESCEFRKKKMSLSIGHTKSRTAIILPEEAECRYAIWSSSDESIASVNENGEVTGVSKGVAKITATTLDGQFSAQYTVKVRRTFWQWTKYYIFFGWTAKKK